eukprot:TRINITY_DN12612_c0_g1_i1.p1 TRINITY_DN12612_c0_g1~~TRINITY_DN12612_c0_g1_i1.p1  ORF type:complete len:391 (+),score=36.31 TRINITY_DN12612_c0_g1_i1:23-1195(+)
MKKKMKPIPLDVDNVAEAPREPPASKLPETVPSRYANLLSCAEGYGDWEHEGKRLRLPAGLSSIGTFESNQKFSEGAMVVLKPDAEEHVAKDGRFPWVDRMHDFMGVQGEVKCIDLESCLLEMDTGSIWLPMCCCDPVVFNSEPPSSIEVGQKVVLKKEAKAICCLSTYVWNEAVTHAFQNAAKPATVKCILRGVTECCRVRFGGYLWAFPASAIEHASAITCNRRASPASAQSYLDVYTLACKNYNCRPNSALMKFFGGERNIEVLDLSSNLLGTQGLRALSDVIRSNVSITELILPYNDIRTESLGFLLSALSTDRIIKKIDLSNNPLGPAAAKPLRGLVAANPVIQQLQLQNTEIPADTIAEISRQMEARRITHERGPDFEHRSALQ